MPHVVTVADQGYRRNEGNLLDAATSALALYNLPQSMKLQMERARLQNQGMGLQNTGQGVQNQTGQFNLQQQQSVPAAGKSVNDMLNQFGQPGSNPAGLPSSNSAMPPDDSPANGRSGPPSYGPKTTTSPGSIDDASGNMYANTNENSSSGGISNDLTVRGTSAEEMGIDPYSTDSMLSAAHANVLANGVPGTMNQNAPQMANGMNARSNSDSPLKLAGNEIPGSTQGGGPFGSPFNSLASTKGTSFNSGETGDNAGSMPREDSNTVPLSMIGPKGAALKPGARIRQGGSIYTVA
jgi:hypothetical protein